MFAQSLMLGVLAVALPLSAALADTVKFHAVLSPTTEVPPTKSTGTGTADASLDTVTHILTYDIVFQGTTSQVTMAHFHGPAAAGQNAPIVVPLGTNPKSPIHGTATLTPEQQQQLMSGMWYANVHTTNFPAGAIRGQMEVAK